MYCFGLSNSEQQIIKIIRPNWVTKPIDIPVRISKYVHYTDYMFISGFIVLFFVSFSVAIVFVSFLVHFLVNEFCFTYTVIFSLLRLTEFIFLSMSSVPLGLLDMMRVQPEYMTVCNEFSSALIKLILIVLRC